jgi:O-antigen ligase
MTGVIRSLGLSGGEEQKSRAAMPSAGVAPRLQRTLLIAGLCGPAIGAFGVYGANVLVFLSIPWLLAQRRRICLPSEQVFMLLLGVLLLGYVLAWAVISGGSSWAFSHLAIVFLSGTAFLTTALVSCHAGASEEVLSWITKFTWVLLCLCVLEAVTGVRLPVSRYSPVAPTLGFVYEGHEGASESFEGLWIPTGLFGNQNNLALTVLCLMPFAWAGTQRGGARLVLFVLASSVLVVSESRTALAVAVGWGLVTLMIRLIRHRPAWALLLTLAAGAAGIYRNELFETACGDSTRKVCWALLVAQNASLDDLMFSPDSIGVRFQLASQAWQLWTESALFGVGPGHLGGLISALHMDGVVLTDAHNALLQILAEYGVVGSAVWLAGAVVLLRALLRVPESEGTVREFRRAALVFLALLPFASITVSTMYYFVPIWVLGGAVFGVSLGERPQGRVSVARPKFLPPGSSSLDSASRAVRRLGSPL